MVRDVLLGALATSTMTTATGRKALLGAGRIGLKMLEVHLKNVYNVDLKSIIDEEEGEEQCINTNVNHAKQRKE